MDKFSELKKSIEEFEPMFDRVIKQRNDLLVASKNLLLAIHGPMNEIAPAIEALTNIINEIKGK